jgi:hypothetical protein
MTTHEELQQVSRLLKSAANVSSLDPGAGVRLLAQAFDILVRLAMVKWSER